MTVDQLYESVRSKISKSFDLPEGTGIFFAPSQASAQYIIHMIINALHPEIESFHNIITGTRREDIDQNFLIASQGQFFSSAVFPNGADNS